MQGYFLCGMGIEERVRQMAETVEDDSKVDDIIKSAERLVHKDQMGEVYKVCCVTTGGLPTGFEGRCVKRVCCRAYEWAQNGEKTLRKGSGNALDFWRETTLANFNSFNSQLVGYEGAQYCNSEMEKGHTRARDPLPGVRALPIQLFPEERVGVVHRASLVA